MTTSQKIRSTLPVIAIVGQPNVGKSTLFNCLTHTQAALISDFPGLTRDRQYGEADYHGHHFIVIDTGGLSDEDNAMNQLTRQQSRQAIEEADLVVFVVDARKGCTPQDHFIAQQIRSLHKKVVIAANKAESMDSMLAIAEFYALGLGQSIPLSASHHLGIASLVTAVFDLLPPPSDTPPPHVEKGIQLAVVGRPNVGKSTLINRLLGEERVIVYDEPGTTRDSLFIPLERQGKHYTLIDTAGIRRRGKIINVIEKFSIVKTLQAIHVADVILFILDATEGITEQDLRLLGHVLDSGKALVIAINKWDGLTTEQREKAHASIDRRLNFAPFVKIQCISALHGSGVGHLFPLIEEAYDSAHQTFPTAQLTAILHDAINSHSPPLVNGRRIKLRYAHAGGQHPPVIVIHGNQVEALPDSYRRYLANTYQKALQLVGTPVRIALKKGSNPYRPTKHKKQPDLKRRGRSRRKK